MNHPTRCPHCSSDNVIFSKRRQMNICEDCDHEFALKAVFNPLRLFLSYGHDSNEELVRRIRADLEQRGHDVWFDKSEIKAGDDWRRSITEGIAGSQKFVSFLSRHSTRDPGVCRDEIAIAIGVKGGNIQTILVESEYDVQPPASIGHIQWLDMHDWKERRAAGEASWEEWYRAQLTEIIRVVESDESRRFAGEIETLSGHLKPIRSDARICRLLSKGFYGRQWLFDAVESWRQDTERNSRLFWIMGAPGVGKSAFAAQLTHTRGDAVIAAQFCDWNMVDHRDARRVIQSLAFQIATRLPDYRKLLLTLPEIAELDRKDTAELFDYLVANPLRSVIDGGRNRYLIVIDALDEAGDGGRNPLVEILARNAQHLPDWLGFVVTSRPESDVIASLQGLNPFVFDTTTESNRQDIRDYLLRELVSQLQDRKDADLLVDQILQKSEGVFLYVERFCDDIQQDRLSLDRPEQFPQGLGGIFWQYFQRQFPDLTRYGEFVRPALRAILAAREPLPVELLQQLFNWRSEQRSDFTRVLGSLFPVTTEAGREIIKTYHKSLSDWLANKDLAQSYAVDVAEGHSDLAVWLWSHRHLPPLTASAAAYSIKHLPMHLLKAGDWKGLHRLLNEDLQSWLHYWVEQGGVADGNDCIEYLLKHLHQGRIDADLQAVLANQLARLQAQGGRYSEARNTLRERALPLCSWWRRRKQRAVTEHELGSLELYDGNVAVATRQYLKALAYSFLGFPAYWGEVAANAVGLASLEILKGQFVRSQRWCVLSQFASWLIRDIPHRLATARLMARSAIELGQYSRASRYLEQGLRISDRQGYRVEQVRLLIQRGWMELDLCTLSLQNATACRQTFEFAESIAADCALSFELWECRIGRCWAALAAYETEEAIRLVKPFETVLDGTFDMHAARKLVTLAAVRHQAGELEHARDLYRQGEVEAKRKGTRTWLRMANIGIGATSLHLSDESIARTTWADAESEATSISAERGKLCRASIEGCRKNSKSVPTSA